MTRVEKPVIASEKARKRVEEWLAKRKGLYASPDVVAALIRCRSAPALEFAAAVLSVPGWRCLSTRHFENHTYRLELNAVCGGHSVQLLFSSRWGKEMVALDIVSETAQENALRRDDKRAQEIREAVGKYVRLTVGRMPRALRWLVQSLEAELSQRREQDVPPSLVGRASTGDLDWAVIPPPVRETRLRAWLEVHRMKVNEAYFPVLAQCETTAEMRFLTPVLQVLEWRVIDQNRLRARGIELRVHWEFDGGHFDFLVGGRSATLSKPFAIEIVRPYWQRKDSSASRVQQAAHLAGYLLEEVPSVEAARRGAWWSHLLKQATAETEARRLRVSDQLHREISRGEASSIES